MAVPLNLKDIQSGFLSASTFNENNTLTEEALAKTLNRTSNAVDNAMEVNLDMGLNSIFNLEDAFLGHEATTLSQVQKLIQASSSGLISRLRETRKTASAGQTVFNLADITYTTGVNNIMVYVNGVAQVAGIDYQETDSTTITFLSALEAGDFVDVYVNEATTSQVTDAQNVSYGQSSNVDEALDKRTIFRNTVAEIEALSVPEGTNVFLTEEGKSGDFEFDSSDLSTEVSADSAQNNYIAPSSDPTGASGAFVYRSDRYPDPIAPAYLKTVSDIITGSDVSVLRFIDRAEHAKIKAGTSTADLNARFQAAVDAVSAEAGRGNVLVPYGRYYKPGTLNIPEEITLFSEGGASVYADDGGIMLDIDEAVNASVRGLSLESLAGGDALRINGFCTSNIDRLNIKGFKRAIWESGFGGVGENYITRCNIQATDIADSFGIWSDSTDNYHIANKVKGCNTAYRARGGGNRYLDNHSFRSPSADTAIGYLIEGIETQINGGRVDTCSNANVFLGGQGVGNTCSISGLFMGTATAYAGAALLGIDGAQILELDAVYSIPVDATITDGTTTGKVYLTDSNGAGGNTRVYVNRRDGIILNSASVTIDGTINATVVARVRPRIVGLNVTGCTFSNAEIATNGVASYRLDADVDMANSERTTVEKNTFINVDAFATSVNRNLSFLDTNSGSTNLGDYILGSVAQVRFSQIGGNEKFKLGSVTNDATKNVQFQTESGSNTTTEATVMLEAESLISKNGKDFFTAL